MNSLRLFPICLLSFFLFLPFEATNVAAENTAVTSANTTHYLPLIQTAPPPPANLLNNPSFEGGWYHPNGIPELQIPDQWTFYYEEGDNPFSADPWNAWVRPEVRVLSKEFLPPEEHDLFIWDGEQTMKVFKGYGSISFRMETAVDLQPGNYIFEIHVYPDLVVDYQNGQKVFATDPTTGDVMLEADGQSTGWLTPAFGQKNQIQLPFTVDSVGNVTIKASFRGRWAIRNNGWFMDDWSIYQTGNS